MNSTPDPADSATTARNGEQIVVFGALYWRKNWFGPSCPPSILFFRSGWLRLESDKEVIFDAPIDHVGVRQTWSGTLNLVVDGCTYPLIGTAGATARSLSAEQMAMLGSMAALPHAWNFSSSEPSLYARAKTNGRGGLSFGASGTAIRALGAGAATSATAMSKWAVTLGQLGATRL